MLKSSWITMSSPGPDPSPHGVCAEHSLPQCARYGRGPTGVRQILPHCRPGFAVDINTGTATSGRELVMCGAKLQPTARTLSVFPGCNNGHQRRTEVFTSNSGTGPSSSALSSQLQASLRQENYKFKDSLGNLKKIK